MNAKWDVKSGLANVRWGILLALLTIIFGQALGVAFGVFEDAMKGYLKAEGERAFEAVYAGNRGQLDATVTKSWSYFKRAHLHAGGMGTTALALITLVALLPGQRRFQRESAAALSAGALGYAVFWLMAGMRAPALGGTAAAKESLAWLALPSVGLFVGTTLLFAAWTVVSLFSIASHGPDAPSDQT